MRYQPAKRRQRSDEMEHPNITPMMNLMVVLIPLLLTSAEFVRLGVIELNLPPAASGPQAAALQQIPTETQRKLDLTVSITDRGFIISSSLAVLSGVEAGEPTIPTRGNGYDFPALSAKLYEIKQAASGKFPDTDQIIIMAEPEVDYQTIISTMDASRAIEQDGAWQMLFPDVSLSAGVY